MFSFDFVGFCYDSVDLHAVGLVSKRGGLDLTKAEAKMRSRSETG